MTTTNPAIASESRPARRRKRGKAQTALFARGEPMLWLTGGALVICLTMIVGLLVLIVFNGVSTFWPAPILEVKTIDGRVLLGEVDRVETYRPQPHVFDELPPERVQQARQQVQRAGGLAVRQRLRTEMVDHFEWVDDFAIREQSNPPWAVLVERFNESRLYGTPAGVVIDGAESRSTPEAAWSEFSKHHPEILERRASIRALEMGPLRKIDAALEAARLKLKQAEPGDKVESAAYDAAVREHEQEQQSLQLRADEVNQQIAALSAANDKFKLILNDAAGNSQSLPMDEIVRAYPANQLGWFGRCGVYFSRWWEFLSDEPRQSNSEGGVFPAIFGTVVMTLVMSMAVVPFGVLAALYLREYAKGGLIVSCVRIAINNLAGVPSIVFGVFGLGFFCYLAGGAIDNTFYQANLPNPTFGKGALIWASFTLALMTVPVVIVATEEAVSAVPNSMREGSFACGASKWQTIRRIILPRALPGIMTGVILAMARGAGEVAPLMLVGALKMAPELPFDWVPPFGANRSFMHLGFHIFDVGLQSQNSEAGKPMVFTTTLLLITIIAVLNLTAVSLRARLRRRFGSAQF